jgi:hypothetical protein
MPERDHTSLRVRLLPWIPCSLRPLRSPVYPFRSGRASTSRISLLAGMKMGMATTKTASTFHQFDCTSASGWRGILMQLAEFTVNRAKSSIAISRNSSSKISSISSRSSRSSINSSSSNLRRLQ